MTSRPGTLATRAALVGACLLTLSCSLPRYGTSVDAGPPEPDASADGSMDADIDAGPICDPPDCADGNGCTEDLCTGTGCAHLANAERCDDGVFCNGFDTCAEGACQPGAGSPCAGSTLCDEARHACVHCTSDADCHADVPPWSSCDFGGSACALAGTHSRTATIEAHCDTTADECVFTTEPQTEACTRPASDTDGASCAEGASAGLCQDGTCCTGCLSGASCNAGNTDTSCGAAGAACVSCGGATPRCGPAGSCVQCTGASDCDDGNANTVDACLGNVCSHDCSGCMSGTTCVAGISTAACGIGGGSCSSCGFPRPYCVVGACIECVNAAACDDTNPCTTDGCLGGSCTHTTTR